MCYFVVRNLTFKLKEQQYFGVSNEVPYGIKLTVGGSYTIVSSKLKSRTSCQMTSTHEIVELQIGNKVDPVICDGMPMSSMIPMAGLFETA